jgi:hypothetical protein
MKRFLITGIFASAIIFAFTSFLPPEPDKTPLKAQVVTKTVTPAQISDYLANPGIGWQETKTPSNPILPETVVYKRSDYSWADQNPGDNNFNWGAVDSDLAVARNQGKQFSFRIYTMKGPGFGGAQIPQWVIDNGATLINGRPDYSNCIYQDEWGKFVNAMVAHYDGNPNVAFIDISGYGDFNEWSWNDDQTNITPGSIDGQARQRLIDMFMGGSGTIQCKDRNGQQQSVNYSYPGYRLTQLVMPYAGIQESSRYAQSKSANVGFRHDCLGRIRASDDLIQKVGDVIDRTWPIAPVVFEYCGNNSTTPQLLANADELLQRAHGSLTHDNFSGSRDVNGLTNILRNVGYRYLVKSATFPSIANPGSALPIDMTWTNVGYAPNYPKMGQTFTEHTYLIDANGNVVVDDPSNANTASWIPGDHLVSQVINLPSNLAAGTYQIKVAIIDRRTGLPINLAFVGRDENGRYPLDTITITSEVLATGTPTPQPTATGTPTPSTTPTATPTNSPISQASSTPSPIPTSSPIPTVTPSASSTPTSTPTSSPAAIALVTSMPTPTPASPVPVVAGAATELPNTGMNENVILIYGGPLAIGIILRNKFKLI